MITAKINIDSVEKVKKFTAAISKIAVECELVEGFRIIDAKSIMGIFSLDLKKPIELRVHTEDRRVLEPLRDFILPDSADAAK